MCLAIPGRIHRIEPEHHYATVDIGGVRRRINIDLVGGEALAVGDWVLIHVGFAMSTISPKQAAEQIRLLHLLGEAEAAEEEAAGYRFGTNDLGSNDSGPRNGEAP